MNDSILPDRTHIEFEERGTEFLDEASENDDRRALSGFSNNQNNQEFDAAEQPFVRITGNLFGDGICALRGTKQGER